MTGAQLYVTFLNDLGNELMRGKLYIQVHGRSAVPNLIVMQMVAAAGEISRDDVTGAPTVLHAVTLSSVISPLPDLEQASSLEASVDLTAGHVRATWVPHGPAHVLTALLGRSLLPRAPRQRPTRPVLSPLVAQESPCGAHVGAHGFVATLDDSLGPQDIRPAALDPLVPEATLALHTLALPTSFMPQTLSASRVFAAHKRDTHTTPCLHTYLQDCGPTDSGKLVRGGCRSLDLMLCGGGNGAVLDIRDATLARGSGLGFDPASFTTAWQRLAIPADSATVAPRCATK
jgi:hypothetical protein